MLNRLDAPLSLRFTITTGLGLVAALAVLSSILLVALTTKVRSSGDDVAASLRSIRFAEGAEIELLLHARTTDRIVRAAHESEMRQQLSQAAEHVTTPAEQEAWSTAAAKIDGYLALARQAEPPAETPAALWQAFAALEGLVDVNEQQFRLARERASKADRLANGVGLAVVFAVAPLVAILTWWLWKRAFAPLFDLGHSMQRFATGDRAWRAGATGATELREMAQRFNDMAGELVRQREAQMAFLAGIAHDLRNPLMPLRIAATLLADPERASAPAGRAELLRIVARQVDHLERMIGDLLETSRVEAGHFDLQLEQVDAGSLVAEVVEPFRSAAPAHVFAVSTPESPVFIRGDALRVMQVLNNLVSNAVKYSPEGGRIAVSVRTEAGEAVVSVEDEGIGIPSDEQDRLFQPFRRTRRAAASTIPGVGLGLFVARRIVEAHGGRLDLRSRPGAGSTFVVRLPLAWEEPPVEPSASLVAGAAPDNA